MAFDQNIADKVCEAIALGSSLRKACEEHGTTHPTFLRWVDNDVTLADQYTRARNIGWALLADEVIAISDDGSNDTYTRDDGMVMTNNDVVARSRLRVDSRKWMLSKMLPKVYGDKLDMAVSGDLTVLVRKMTLPDATPSVHTPKSAPKDGV